MKRVCDSLSLDPDKSAGASPLLTPDLSRNSSLWPGGGEILQQPHPTVRADRLLLRGRSHNQLSVAPPPMPTYSGWLQTRQYQSI